MYIKHFVRIVKLLLVLMYGVIHLALRWQLGGLNKLILSLHRIMMHLVQLLLLIVEADRFLAACGLLFIIDKTGGESALVNRAISDICSKLLILLWSAVIVVVVVVVVYSHDCGWIDVY